MDSTTLASPTSLNYLAVDNSLILTTPSDNSIDSGTETESHRSPSDSENFDGKLVQIFPGEPLKTSVSGMDVPSTPVIPPPPSMSIPLPPSLLIPPPPSFIPPPPGVNFQKQGSGNISRTNKLRRLNWEKIPDIHIRNAEEETIWGGSNSQKSEILVDFKAIDDLFTLEDKPLKRRSPSTRSFNSTPVGDSDSSNPEDGKVAKVSFLDSKRSLNINIFLRQFKRSTAILAESIRSCDVSFMNSDKLRALQKLLPDKQELETLQEYAGKNVTLDTAEDFLCKIISIPFYQIRIDSVLLREEFDSAMSQVEKSIKILQEAMTEIRRCYALPTILHLVLQAGNYLNQGAAYGNASGFRLASLKKITDTKANKPGMTLMHYVAMELEKHDPNMMKWVAEVHSVGQASRISEEEITEEIVNFRNRVRSLKREVMGEVGEELKQKVGDFLEKSEGRLNVISEQEQLMKESTKELRVYLCERSHRFSLNTCFQIVAEFRNKFKKAMEENVKREKANKKKRLTSLQKSGCDSMTNINNCNSVVVDQNKNPTTDENDNISKSEVQQFGSLRRSRSVATPHQRFQGIKNSRDVNDMSSLPRQSSLRRNDTSFTRRASLAKPSPQEVIEIFKRDTSKNEEMSKIEEKPKLAWAESKSNASQLNTDEVGDKKCGSTESLATGLLVTRHKRRHVQRTRSLRGGLWNDYQDSDDQNLFLGQLAKENENNSRSQSMIAPHSDINEKSSSKSDDLEASFDRFVDRERTRMFERTQLRRSYMCIPRCKEELSEKADSDNEGLSPLEARRKMFQRKSSPLASKSEVIMRSKSTSRILPQDDDVDPYSSNATSALEATDDVTSEKRRDDLRERIRKYKESTSSNEDSWLERRRSSSGSSLLEYSNRQKHSGTNSLVADKEEESPKTLLRRNTYNGPERVKKSSISLLPPMHENETETVPTKDIPTGDIDGNVVDQTVSANSDTEVFETVVSPEETTKEEAVLESSDLVSDIDSSVTEDKSNTIPRRRKSSLYKHAHPPTTWKSNSSLVRASSQSTLSPDSSPDRRSITATKTTPKRESAKPPSGLRSPSKILPKSPSRRVGTPAVGVKSFIRNLATPKKKAPDKSKMPVSPSVSRKIPLKKLVNSKSGTDSAYSDNGGDSTDCDVILSTDSNKTTHVMCKPLPPKQNISTKAKNNTSPAKILPKKPETPSANKTLKKRAILPKKESSPAAIKHTSSIVPASANNLNRTARLRQNKLQQQNLQASKSPQRVNKSVKPASHATSPEKKTIKSTPNTKRNTNTTVAKKKPVPKTVAAGKTSTAVTAAKSKLPKKANHCSKVQIKVNGKDVTDDTPLKTEINVSVQNETSFVGNSVSASSDQKIKETNLSDLPDADSPMPAHSGLTTSSLSPHSGVQLNRAARLRLSKRMAQRNSVNKAVFV